MLTKRVFRRLTQHLEANKLSLPYMSYMLYAAAEPTFHFICEIRCWRTDTETQNHFLGTPVVLDHFHFSTAIVLTSNLSFPLSSSTIKKIRSDGSSQLRHIPVVWNSLIPTPLLSIPFCIFVVCVCVFSCVPLISGDLMDEDGRCPADYQSRQMKAEAGRQLAGVFYQTHLRWIPTVSVCVVLYVSICLRLLKTGAASCFTEREYSSLTDIWPVWSFTHTDTRPSLCISWPLQWMMTGVDCIRVQHRAANTHICGWWSERTHRKKITSDVMN